MDITPVIPKGKHIIKGYGNGAFRINDELHEQNLIVMPDKVQVWEKGDLIALDSLATIDNIDILLIGCGDTHQPLPPEIQQHFSEKRIGIEIMTTGAACRTYNVLLAEGRNVAAALVLV